MISTAVERAFRDSLVDEHGMLEKAIEWITSNYLPEEVYSLADLEEWAKENQYVKTGDDR